MNKDDLREIICSGHDEIRNRFKAVFASEIDQFLEALLRASITWEEFDKKCGQDIRQAYAFAFLFTAINSLATSFHFLITGYIAPAGNVARHIPEAIAMAILVSEPSLPYLKRLEQEKQKFPFHKAVIYVGRHLKLLGINKEAWKRLEKTHSFLNADSHASLFYVSSLINFGKASGVSLGPHFDEVKLEGYRSNITFRIKTAIMIEQTIEVLAKRIGRTVKS